jgi:hypothetical protein
MISVVCECLRFAELPHGIKNPERIPDALASMLRVVKSRLCTSIYFAPGFSDLA